LFGAQTGRVAYFTQHLPNGIPGFAFVQLVLVEALMKAGIAFSTGACGAVRSTVNDDKALSALLPAAS
jgi:hypothetical protein